MRRAIIGHPENPIGGTVWFLPHDQVNQAAVRRNACGFFTKPEDFRSSDIPGSQVGQGSGTLIFKFNTLAPTGVGSRMKAAAVFSRPS
jgi:hypothetical protein